MIKIYHCKGWGNMLLWYYQITERGNNMRTFLICEEKINWNNGKRESLRVKGIYMGDMYPSTIKYDPDYSYSKYGVRYPRIIEVTEHCDVELM